MRKEKEEINIMILNTGFILIAGGSLCLAVLAGETIVSYGLYLISFITLVLWVRNLLKKRKIDFSYLWRDIYKSACTKINYSSSDFGLKRNLGHILNKLCDFADISAVWVLMKNVDGNYRVEALRGAEILRHDFGIKDLSEYIAADIKNFDKPIIRKHLPPHSKTHKKAAYLHIPITRGKLIRGVLTVSGSSAKCFKRLGPDNFLIIARLIEQLYDNLERNNQLLNMARKVNEKVDVATDELTKTNLRLIDRVKEMKSLYDLSLKVINAETTSKAARLIFSKIKVILGAEKSLFFEKNNGKFILRYVSGEDPDKVLKERILPFSILPQKKGIILNDTTKDKDLNNITEKYGLNNIMIAPVKAGENIKGLIISGVKKAKDFSGRDIELLEMYANRLGEYIERGDLLDRIMRDNKRLKELNEVKDKFIALISHELRTPLTSIKGFGELLLNGDAGQVNSDQQDFLKTILKSASKLELTINNIIEVTDFKKDEVELEKENVKWEEFINDVVEEFRQILNTKEINCKIEIDNSIGELYVDRKRIKKVFKNLINNSVKFMDRKGAITVTSDKFGSKVKTIIKDTGIGIDKTMEDKVFEGFTQVQETLTRDADGLGLGLTLVKYIIETHGGDIDIKSTPGEGTEVIFNLPAGRLT